MTVERSNPSFTEQVAQWRVKENSAVAEADRIRGALERRASARGQNAAAIEAKLVSGVTDRQRVRLQRELGFLTSYDERHPTGEKAVDKHIWISFGLNYSEVMRQRTLRGSK